MEPSCLPWNFVDGLERFIKILSIIGRIIQVVWENGANNARDAEQEKTRDD